MFGLHQFFVRQKLTLGTTIIATTIKSWLVTPFFRFFLLGLMLWLGNSYIEWRHSFAIEAPTKEQLEISAQDWARRTGYFPNEQQRAEIFQTELADRALFKEAVRQKLYLDDPVVYQRLLKNAEFLAIKGDDTAKIGAALSIGLHLNDELIRRHLIEKLKMLIRARAYPLPAPSDSLLHARYLDTIDRWKVAPSLEIEQVFFSADSADIAARLNAAKEKLTTQSLADQQAYSLGDKFLLGNKLSLMELPKLRDIFGAEFADSLQAILGSGNAQANLATWFGPIKSAYGFHFVKIITYKKPTYRDFEEVKAILTNEYYRGLEANELKEYIAELLNKYTVKERLK